MHKSPIESFPGIEEIQAMVFGEKRSTVESIATNPVEEETQKDHA